MSNFRRKEFLPIHNVKFLLDACDFTEIYAKIINEDQAIINNSRKLLAFHNEQTKIRKRR